MDSSIVSGLTSGLVAVVIGTLITNLSKIENHKWYFETWRFF